MYIKMSGVSRDLNEFMDIKDILNIIDMMDIVDITDVRDTGDIWAIKEKDLGYCLSTF